MTAVRRLLGPVAGVPERLEAVGRASDDAARELRWRARSLADALDRCNAGTVRDHWLPTTLPAAVRHLAALLEELDGFAAATGRSLAAADGGVGWADPFGLAPPAVPTGDGHHLGVLVRTSHPRLLDPAALAATHDEALLAGLGRDPSLPVAVRDRLNRAAMHVAADHLAARPWLPDGEAQRLASLRHLLDVRVDVRVLSFVASEGRDREPTAQLLLGDPEAADGVAVWVPGTTHGLHTLADDLAAADRLRAAADTAGGDLAVVVDLYDAPDTLPQARRPAYGRHHAPALAGLVADVRRQGADRVVLVGHSYGSFAVGRAAALRPDADALVLLGTPGVGADHVTDLGWPGESVWVARAPKDPIEVAADADEWLVGPWLPVPDAFALGTDPADPDFGARVFEVNDADADPGDPTWVQGHSDYLLDGSRSLENVVRICLGQAPTVPSAADLPARVEAADGPGGGWLDRTVPGMAPEWWLGSDGSRAVAAGSW